MVLPVYCAAKRNVRERRGELKERGSFRKGVIKREIGKEMDAKNEKLEGKRGNVEKSYQSDSMKSSC